MSIKKTYKPLLVFSVLFLIVSILFVLNYDPASVYADLPEDEYNQYREEHKDESYLPPYDDGGYYEIKTDSGQYKCGSAIEANNFRVAFLDYDPDFTGYPDWVELDRGNRLARAYFRFTNLSDEKNSCGSFDFTCYADGVLCHTDYIGDSNSLASYEELSKNRTMEGWIYIQVPEKAQEIELEYTIWGSDYSPIFVLDG